MDVPKFMYYDNLPKKTWDLIQSYFGDCRKLNIKYWEKFGLSDYRHNWNIELYQGAKIQVGIEHNSKFSGDNGVHDIRLEYNPSHYGGMIPDIVAWIFGISSRVRLKRLDYAYDIKVDPSDLVSLEVKKQWNIYKGTRYYGAQGKDQLVIYDKAQELSSKGEYESDDPLTRIEYRLYTNQIVYEGKITTLNYHFEIEDNQYPDIYYLSHLCDSKPDLALMTKGAINDPILFKALSYHKRRKIKDYLKKGKKISFSTLSENIEKEVRSYIGDIVEMSVVE